MNNKCPACREFQGWHDDIYLQGVVLGIAMAEGKTNLGSYEAILGNATFCDKHKKRLATLIDLARKAMRGELP